MNTYLEAAGKEGAFYKEAHTLSLLAEEELEALEINAEGTCAAKRKATRAGWD